jgi:hypothetical protein
MGRRILIEENIERLARSVSEDSKGALTVSAALVKVAMLSIVGQ